jgi:tRNA-dihydrouridine synthase B
MQHATEQISISKPSVSRTALQLPSRYCLAPLAGFTHLSFRRVIRELGGLGLATTDLVSARGLISESSRSLRIIATCPEDKPLAVQIFGQDGGIMADAAGMLEERGVAVVDINMGCPVDRVMKTGAGASLMRCADDAVALARRVAETVTIPVTVKMRLGWNSHQIIAPQLARAFEQAGIAAITLHGRTREQKFHGSVNLEGIRQTVQAVDSIPVFGNGDVRTVNDAERMLRQTGCAGISIGRGALANPWIFRQLTQWERTGEYDDAGNFEDRMGLLLRQFAYLEKLEGTEAAIITFRKIGHWYLKAMRVRAWLRNQFQMAKTREEFQAALDTIMSEGPIGHDKTQPLASLAMPVPTRSVEHY